MHSRETHYLLSGSSDGAIMAWKIGSGIGKLAPGYMDSLQKKLGSTMDHLLPWSDHGQEDVRTRSLVLSGGSVLGRSSTPSFLLSPTIFRYTLGH